MSEDDVKRLLAEATPGPWRTAGRIWMVVSESDRLLCDCIGDTDMGLREARANAALIAAAPDIARAYLEQCETVARFTNDLERKQAVIQEAHDLISRQRDAIEALEARLATIEAATIKRCATTLDKKHLEQANANNAAWVDCEPTIGLQIEKAYADAARMIRDLAPLDTEAMVERAAKEAVAKVMNACGIAPNVRHLSTRSDKFIEKLFIEVALAALGVGR